MNYRTLAKGALALSLSLIVGTAAATTSDVQLYGATFESTANGVTNDNAYVADTAIGTYTKTEGGATYGWLAPEGDESKIIAVNGGQALQLNTDAGTLTNKLAPTSVAAPLNSAIAGTGTSKGAYIETEAKFVASDTLDAGVVGGTDDTKFAIYAYADENATPCTTNLVVYHAYVDMNSTTGISYTNDVTDILINTDVYSKLRVEIKQVDLDGEGNMVNAFSVKIDPGDGTVRTVSTDTAFNEATYGVGTGSLFLTVEKFEVDANKLLASITFKGTGEVDNLAVGTIEEAAAPTVFSVATVGNATISGADGLYTISVPVGNGLSSVYVNGAAVNPSLLTDNQDGTYDLDLTTAGLTGNVNVVVATKKVRTPIGHKWFENPGVIATNLAGHAGDAGPYRFSVGSDFAAISYGNHNNSGTGFKLFSVDSLLSGNATPIYTETLANAQSLNISSIRGAAISEALDVALLTAYSGGKAYSLPLSANTLELGVNAFEITNDQGITFDRAYFSADNQYLYTTETSGGTNTKIAKWAIADGLKGSGQKLTLVTEYTMPARVRDFAYAVINNKELFYVLKDGTAGVCVYDVAGGTNVQLTAQLTNGGNYGSVAVSMTSTSTPTLTVLPSMSNNDPQDPMVVYQLAADGLSIANTLATFTVADLTAAGATGGSYIRSAWPSEDDETLYLGFGGDNLYVLQYVEPPAPPTVITVACVNGATYTEADGVYTFSAPNGYTVSSVFTNGVSANTTTTLDLSAAEGDIKVVVAATKTRTAPAHKWYENPGVIGSTEWGIGSKTDGNDARYYGPYNMDVDGDFITVPTWTGNPAYLELYNRDDIDAGNATYLAKIEQANYGYSFMGSGLCVPLNVAIAGAYSGSYVVALPLNNANPVLGQDAFIISNSLNATLIQFKFTDDAQYVYARPYSGTKVYKFKVLNGLKTTGVNLVDPVTYEFGQRVRSFDLAQIGGNDIVYALLEDKTISVVDTSVATPTAVPLISEVALSKYINISVSGIADGTPHLTVASCTQSATRVDVYTLNAAGTAVDTSIEKKSFDTTAVTAWGVSTGGATGADAVVVDDEGTLYLGYGSKLYAIQYVAPPVPTYAVDWTGSQNVDVTVDGLAWDGGTAGNFTNNTVVTFTPTEGNVITNVNGEAVSLRGLDLTVTEATNIVVLAGVQSQPQGYNYPEGTAISDAAQLAWIAAKGFTQGDITALGTNAKFNECYLLNCNIAAPGAGGSIAITDIEVGTSGVIVTVELTRSGAYAGEGINGTLKLFGKADLATGDFANTSATVGDAKFTSGTSTTATVSGGTAKFFKAVIE